MVGCRAPAAAACGSGVQASLLVGCWHRYRWLHGDGILLYPPSFAWWTLQVTVLLWVPASAMVRMLYLTRGEVGRPPLRASHHFGPCGCPASRSHPSLPTCCVQTPYALPSPTARPGHTCLASSPTSAPALPRWQQAAPPLGPAAGDGSGWAAMLTRESTAPCVASSLPCARRLSEAAGRAWQGAARLAESPSCCCFISLQSVTFPRASEEAAGCQQGHPAAWCPKQWLGAAGQRRAGSGAESAACSGVLVLCC